MWLLAQLTGLIVVISMLIPDIRQTLFSIGIIAPIFLGIVVLCVVVFALDRAATQEHNLKVITGNVSASPFGDPAQKPNAAGPEAERTPEQKQDIT
jgi:hypothetical protein